MQPPPLCPPNARSYYKTLHLRTSLASVSAAPRECLRERKREPDPAGPGLRYRDPRVARATRATHLLPAGAARKGPGSAASSPRARYCCGTTVSPLESFHPGTNAADVKVQGSRPPTQGWKEVSACPASSRGGRGASQSRATCGSSAPRSGPPRASPGRPQAPASPRHAARRPPPGPRSSPALQVHSPPGPPSARHPQRRAGV